MSYGAVTDWGDAVDLDKKTSIQDVERFARLRDGRTKIQTGRSVWRPVTPIAKRNERCQSH